jgi:hypothetical protein
VDWFERLTGFRETNYQDTRAKLRVEGERLHSLVNGKSYRIGRLETPSLKELRKRAWSAPSMQRRLKVGVVQGDVRKLHRSTAYAGALIQVASQFNLLEMVSPEVTPEHGVARYEGDPTQGPACAIAAGAATIYRNYFAPIDSGGGQTADRQIDTLRDVGAALAQVLEKPVEALWRMHNGYALGTRLGLDAIAKYIDKLSADERADLTGELRIGLHWDVEVTDDEAEPKPLVSQAFCSALPVAYSDVPIEHWEPFARLILDAAYEATMWGAVLNAQRSVSKLVLLTRLGGGAFGNDDDWIEAAMTRALVKVSAYDLDVKLVSYGRPSRAFQQAAERFS